MQQQPRADPTLKPGIAVKGAFMVLVLVLLLVLVRRAQGVVGQRQIITVGTVFILN